MKLTGRSMDNIFSNKLKKNYSLSGCFTTCILLEIRHYNLNVGCEK